MGDVAIRVENLGKKYRLGGQQVRYATFRDTLVNAAKAPLGWLKGERRVQPTSFWALDDVSFEVKHGEAVGIIGRNGAGKSTLLKILSRITSPTRGRVDIYGRVGSLLEVGTGFHPELTGRENIFLNGAILGMTRREIMRKFDEIVAFAEIEKFLDTAVKFYSSGMYVRLAFAVAAHLEPEILVVDEVLAVGDAEFQKKCLGKMGDVAREGRTVLFVSHNMGAISQLCKTAILLESGFVKEFDQSSKVIGHYLTFSKENPASIDLNKYPFHQGNQKVKFEWGQVLNSEENVCENFSIGDDILVALSFKLIDSIQSIKLAVELRTSDGIRISNMIDSDSGFQIIEPKKLVRLLVTIKDVRLYPGTYSLSFWAGSKNSVDTYDYVEDCISFNIVDGGNRTMRSLPRSDGLLFLTPEWRLMPDDTSTAVHITTPTESL